jgi:hypothetical protein
MSFGARIDRLKRRLSRQEGEVLFMTVVGDPEVRRLQHFGLLPQGAMASDRHAMVGTAYFEAAPSETTDAFHKRLKDIAKGRGSNMIMLGHPDTPLPLSEAPPYSPPTPDGRPQRYDA